MADFNWILLAIWGLIVVCGGILIMQNLFTLKNDLLLFVGVAGGIVLETFFANFLAQVLPPLAAFWLSAGLILAVGIVLEIKYKHLRAINLKEVLFRTDAFWFVLITILFTTIGLGLPIFDDFQNLPTVSRMAAGDIPPHFALNPEIRFGYHYFLLLVSAQFLRIGDISPALSLDLARSLMMVTTVFLGGKFIFRWTGNRIAEILGMGLLFFSSGVRWLFFFSPQTVKSLLDGNIQLIGSGADSGRTMFEALAGSWRIEAGPIPFPFAFTSGINPPMILALGGVGASATMIIMLVLLNFHSRRNWLGLFPLIVFFASLALANEVWIILFGGGILILSGIILLTRKTIQSRETLLLLGCLTFGGIISLFQGGMLTELARSILTIGNHSGAGSYYDTTIKLIFPPALVSGHLGVLHFDNPSQLLAGFFEIGPVLIAIPFIPYVIKISMKNNDHIKAALGFSAVISSLMIFVLYQGSGGVSGTTRLLEPLLFTATLVAIPLGFSYLEKRGTFVRSLGTLVYSSAILSGVVIFGISLSAIARPVPGDFLRSEDMQVYQELWDTLPVDTIVFDAIPARAVTVLGRATKSNLSWFEKNPVWEDLKLDPSPSRLSAAGFSYAYLDLQDWEILSPETQAQYKSSCSKLVYKIQNEDRGRRLYRIEDCR